MSFDSCIEALVKAKPKLKDDAVVVIEPPKSPSTAKEDKKPNAWLFKPREGIAKKAAPRSRWEWLFCLSVFIVCFSLPFAHRGAPPASSSSGVKGSEEVLIVKAIPKVHEGLQPALPKYGPRTQLFSFGS